MAGSKPGTRKNPGGTLRLKEEKDRESRRHRIRRKGDKAARPKPVHLHDEPRADCRQWEEWDD